MKRFLLACGLMLAAIAVFAQSDTKDKVADTATAISNLNPQILFGYISYDSALVAMPEYATVTQKLAELRKAYDDEMKRVEDEFNRKYEDFLEGQKDFPRTILLKRQTELQEMMQRNMEFKHQGLDELQRCEQEMMLPLREKLNEAIAVVAREKKLALVINTDANACPFIEPSMGVDMSIDVRMALRRL